MLLADAVTTITGVFASLPGDILVLATAGLAVHLGIAAFRKIARVGR